MVFLCAFIVSSHWIPHVSFYYIIGHLLVMWYLCNLCRVSGAEGIETGNFFLIPRFYFVGQKVVEICRPQKQGNFSLIYEYLVNENGLVIAGIHAVVLVTVMDWVPSSVWVKCWILLIVLKCFFLFAKDLKELFSLKLTCSYLTACNF